MEETGSIRGQEGLFGSKEEIEARSKHVNRSRQADRASRWLFFYDQASKWMEKTIQLFSNLRKIRT